MQLHKWFAKYCVNIKAFARKIKVNEVTLHRILNGGTVSLKVAHKIEQGTDFQVTTRDLAEKHDRRVKKRRYKKES